LGSALSLPWHPAHLAGKAVQVPLPALHFSTELPQAQTATASTASRGDRTRSPPSGSSGNKKPRHQSADDVASPGSTRAPAATPALAVASASLYWNQALTGKCASSSAEGRSWGAPDGACWVGPDLVITGQALVEALVYLQLPLQEAHAFLFIFYLLSIFCDFQTLKVLYFEAFLPFPVAAVLLLHRFFECFDSRVTASLEPELPRYTRLCTCCKIHRPKYAQILLV
jgi:hypothetical protein